MLLLTTVVHAGLLKFTENNLEQKSAHLLVWNVSSRRRESSRDSTSLKRKLELAGALKVFFRLLHRGVPLRWCLNFWCRLPSSQTNYIRFSGRRGVKCELAPRPSQICTFIIEQCTHRLYLTQQQSHLLDPPHAFSRLTSAVGSYPVLIWGTSGDHKYLVMPLH